MSLVLLRYRGREIRSEDTAFIQRLIAENPRWSRRRLSAELCRAWNWVQPNGALRDMVCRSLLQLHRAGLVELPETGAQLEQLLAEVRPFVPAATYQRLDGLLQTLQWIMAAFEQKTLSIARLKRMLFGHSTETTTKVFPPQPGTDPASDQASVEPQAKRKGHGRKGSKDYPGAQRVKIAHPTLKVGQRCSQCGRAKLYLLKIPARIIRIVAQPLFQATVCELERLRCALCGAVFTAPAPPEAGTSKYDPSVGTMLALMRHGARQSLYRMDKWQTHSGVPLPASTQWELIEAASATPALVYDALIGIGAQGRLNG